MDVNVMDLPLFPLNVVLFPGMPMQLHIFEERYKEMVQVCLRSNRIFGVALIRDGEEASGPLPEPYKVGCMASIVDIQPLEEGRMNLTVVGRERIQILSLDRESAPYLIGKVETFPLKDGGEESLHQVAKQLRPKIEQYLQLLVRLSDRQREPDPLPDDPKLVAYLAAILLQIPLPEKQTFLEVETITEFYDLLGGIIDRELALLRAMLSESSRDGIGVFSRN